MGNREVHREGMVDRRRRRRLRQCEPRHIYTACERKELRHVRISGRPARSLAVDRFIDYAKGQPGVWFARRDEIARWWLDHRPR